MDLGHKTFDEISREELVELLFRQGKSLQGKNLRKSSWEEITTVLSGTGRSSEILMARLRSTETRNQAIKALRLARKLSRQQSSCGRVRVNAKRRREWRGDPANQILYDDYSESYLTICPHCHRSHCGWTQEFEKDIESENAIFWWHLVDSHLTDLVACRSNLIPTNVVSIESLMDDEAESANVQLSTTTAVEDRLFEYVTRFAKDGEDIRQWTCP